LGLHAQARGAIPALQENGQSGPRLLRPVQTKFELPAGVTAPQSYVHHCHIVEHEDNDMMRPFIVTP